MGNREQREYSVRKVRWVLPALMEHPDVEEAPENLALMESRE